MAFFVRALSNKQPLNVVRRRLLMTEEMKMKIQKNHRKSGLRAAALTLAAALALTVIPAGAAYAGRVGEWRHNSRGWWYRETDGRYPAGTWKKIEGSWYYFNPDKYMATGWKKVEGKWYYLGGDGAMRLNTSVDGYTLGADGAWIE